ncbi:hypothetical protein Ctob_001577, partial [Chrysochromulina tobinii]
MDPKRSKLATLKNLPAAANAFAAGAVAKASGQNGLFVPDGQTTAPASSAGSSPADVALAFLRRALASAPKGGALEAEVMGNVCVALNSLGRHSEALQMAENACEVLRAGGGGRTAQTQLAAMLHNKSCCHEFLGNRTAALETAEAGLKLATKLGLPDDDALLQRLTQSKADLVKALTDPSLAKKAAVVADDGGGKGKSRVAMLASDTLALRCSLPLLEGLLTAKAEAEAARDEARTAANDARAKAEEEAEKARRQVAEVEAAMRKAAEEAQLRLSVEQAGAVALQQKLNAAANAEKDAELATAARAREAALEELRQQLNESRT